MDSMARLRTIQGYLGGTLRHSARGVPHLVVTHNGQQVSICFLAKTRVFRVFSPYPADKQERQDFDSNWKLLRHFRS